jgi:hypothetical protein
VRRRRQRRVLVRDTCCTHVGNSEKVCRGVRHVMGSLECVQEVTQIDSELHERYSFCDRQKNPLGRFLESTKSEIVGFAKDATLEWH